jgi:hypothetical protein
MMLGIWMFYSNVYAMSLIVLQANINGNFDTRPPKKGLPTRLV